MSTNLLARQLLLDFENVLSLEKERLSSYFSKLFTNDAILSKQEVSHADGTISFLYTFPAFSFTSHVFPSRHAISFTISFHDSTEDSQIKLKKIEEELSKEFKWEHVVSSILLNRTTDRQFYLNDGFHVGSLFKRIRLLERVGSPYQDIRVFDTETMGRIMVLDLNVQITDELDDNYTLDMVKHVVDQTQEYPHILIVGAGDLVIPSYLVEKYKNIKRITVVEIDEKVCQTVGKYFKFSNVLETEDAKQFFSLRFEDGGKFVENASKNKELYDGVIIDCTDVDVEDAVASSLFNVQFYKHLREIMKEGAVFSQQITDTNSMKKFEKMIAEAGFSNPKIIFSETPEYSVSLPIGIVKK